MKFIRLILQWLLLDISLTAGEESYFHADNIVAEADDSYICTQSIAIQQPEIYVTKISPVADSNEIHHLVVYAYK